MWESLRLRRVALGMSFVVCLSCLLLANVAPEENLTELIQRLPAVEPADALKTFELQHGFKLVQVASEPQVSDPVDACFDEDGRLYVAEMHGYPYSFEPRAHQPEGNGKKDAGIIRLLEDTNDDGIFESSSLFASGISWPTSVCCYKGGVFVLAPDTLYYFKDNDGDGKSDVKEIVFTGFSRANVQGVANNLKWGLDHFIYGATGSNPADLKRDGMDVASLGRRDFRFVPGTFALESIEGGVQFGHSMDDWGRRFLCSNSDHIRQAVLPLRYLERNPSLSTSNAVRSIAKEGGAAPVFRKSPAEPWRIVRTKRRASDPDFAKRLPPSELVPTGFFTSATGVTIYRGDAYPESFRGNVFIGDVGGNLIHRKTLMPNGAALLAVRADENVEFLTSTDTWFRPTNFVNAPDGTLYILDMYRETIEHPVSIPEDIKAHLNLESGDDRGRVYRLEPPNFARRKTPKLSTMSTAELVPLLASPNGWHRDSAHRLIWERQDKSVVPQLHEMLKSNSEPLGRLHALWSLQGLDALGADDLKTALADAHPQVRVHALRIGESRLAEDSELRAQALKLVADSDIDVRMQLVFSLGEWNTSDSSEALLVLASECEANADLRTAWLSSVPPHGKNLLLAALSDPKQSEKTLIRETARTLGLLGSQDELRIILQAILNPSVSLSARLSLLQSIGSGLTLRNQNLQTVVGNESEIRSQLAEFFDSLATMSGDADLQLPQRKQVVATLAFGPGETAVPALEAMLSPTVPSELQSVALASLAKFGGSEVGNGILAIYSQLTPAMQRQVAEEFLKQKPWTLQLLEAIADGTIKPVELSREQKEILLNHPDKTIQAQAKKILVAEIAGDRAKVIEQYQPALELAGNADEGGKLFRKHCTACHQVGTEGHKVGPELGSVKNKSPDDLLIAILDPNREAQASFLSYTVVTDAGNVLTGMIASESSASITLRRAEGKEDLVLRNQIELMKSNGVSLMPAGLEKELKPQDLANVIAFIKTLPAPQAP